MATGKNYNTNQHPSVLCFNAKISFVLHYGYIFALTMTLPNALFDLDKVSRDGCGE